MADFPAFGGANRAAPFFQKDTFPNFQFATTVNSAPNSPKTVLVAISITNLKTDLISSTLDRMFAYALASANSDLESSTTVEDSTILVPTVHFEIDITKATTQSAVGGTTPGTVSTPVYTTVKTANIDILIENLQLSLLNATLQRIKTYLSASVTTDLNP